MASALDVLSLPEARELFVLYGERDGACLVRHNTGTGWSGWCEHKKKYIEYIAVDSEATYGVMPLPGLPLIDGDTSEVVELRALTSNEANALYRAYIKRDKSCLVRESTGTGKGWLSWEETNRRGSLMKIEAMRYNVVPCPRCAPIKVEDVYAPCPAVSPKLGVKCELWKGHLHDHTGPYPGGGILCWDNKDDNF